MNLFVQFWLRTPCDFQHIEEVGNLSGKFTEIDFLLVLGGQNNVEWTGMKSLLDDIEHPNLHLKALNLNHHFKNNGSILIHNVLLLPLHPWHFIQWMGCTWIRELSVMLQRLLKNCFIGLYISDVSTSQASSIETSESQPDPGTPSNTTTFLSTLNRPTIAYNRIISQS